MLGMGNAIICAVAMMGPVGPTEGGIRMAPGTCLAYQVPDMCCRLEIFHDSQWGSVCPDAFTQTDAQVACRQLGMASSGAHQFKYDSDWSAPPPIWLSHLGCTGSETELGDCGPFDWVDHSVPIIWYEPQNPRRGGFV